jgi:hypothetical protein
LSAFWILRVFVFPCAPSDILTRPDATLAGFARFVAAPGVRKFLHANPTDLIDMGRLRIFDARQLPLK